MPAVSLIFWLLLMGFSQSRCCQCVFFFFCLSFFYLLVGSLCFKLLKLNTDKLQTCGAETKTKTLLNPDAHQAVMWASIWLLSLMIGGGFLGWGRRLGGGDTRKQRHVSTARLRRPIRSLPNKEDEPKKKTLPSTRKHWKWRFWISSHRSSECSDLKCACTCESFQNTVRSVFHIRSL